MASEGGIFRRGHFLESIFHPDWDGVEEERKFRESIVRSLEEVLNRTRIGDFPERRVPGPNGQEGGLSRSR